MAEIWTPDKLPVVDEEADRRILDQLDPTVAILLNKHLSTSTPWYPHVLIKEAYAAGRDIEPGQLWTPEITPVPQSVISALIVGEGTEENLPKYVLQLDKVMGGGSAMEDWTGRWAAEERRHGDVIGTFLGITYLVDPWHVEDVRMQQMSHGSVPQPVTALDGIAYVAFQELATRESHANTGKIVEREVMRLRDELGSKDIILPDEPIHDPDIISAMSPEERDANRLLIIAQVGRKIMKQVSRDETRHYAFYRDILAAAMELEPSATVMAIERQVREFAMPGQDIPGFQEHAKHIAAAGVYDRKVHHRRVVMPVLGFLGIEAADGLSDDAERARDHLLDSVARVGSKLDRIDARAAAVATEEAA